MSKALSKGQMRRKRKEKEKRKKHQTISFSHILYYQAG
jgi:hypothetical protein